MKCAAASFERHQRLVAGVMSGTSLDGVDVAIARLTGHGKAMDVTQLAFHSTPYPRTLRTLLMEAATADAFSVVQLSQLNVRLAHVFADCIRTAMDQVQTATLDLIGSHGQTVRHVPRTEDCAGLAIRSTLQIGDPSVLANLLGMPVVGDFRMADMALGGQGAPLVPYFDWIAFGDAHMTRGLLNVGGIANLTILPAGGGLRDVIAFDTGCGNMVIDALAARLLGQPFDQDGAIAAQGRPSKAVLCVLLQDPYFRRLPPKSTGRAYFGPAYVERLIDACRGLAVADIMATATALTARSVAQACQTLIRSRCPLPLDILIVAGGGCHNRTLMRMLREALAPVPVTSSDAFGISPDAKEALCFAVLAHETMCGYATGIPSSTGAQRAAILGKICRP